MNTSKLNYGTLAAFADFSGARARPGCQMEKHLNDNTDSIQSKRPLAVALLERRTGDESEDQLARRDR
jgi:hypothetical protein